MRMSRPSLNLTHAERNKKKNTSTVVVYFEQPSTLRMLHASKKPSTTQLTQLEIRSEAPPERNTVSRIRLTALARSPPAGLPQKCPPLVFRRLRSYLILDPSPPQRGQLKSARDTRRVNIPPSSRISSLYYHNHRKSGQQLGGTTVPEFCAPRPSHLLQPSTKAPHRPKSPKSTLTHKKQSTRTNARGRMMGYPRSKHKNDIRTPMEWVTCLQPWSVGHLIPSVAGSSIDKNASPEVSTTRI